MQTMSVSLCANWRIFLAKLNLTYLLQSFHQSTYIVLCERKSIYITYFDFLLCHAVFYQSRLLFLFVGETYFFKCSLQLQYLKNIYFYSFQLSKNISELSSEIKTLQMTYYRYQLCDNLIFYVSLLVLCRERNLFIAHFCNISPILLCNSNAEEEIATLWFIRKK